MSTLVLTRGYPGSGKTTAVMEWLNSDDSAKRARSNRDDLRASMFGREGVLSWPEEQQITVAQRAQVTGLLKAGYDVVVDDTNLRFKFAREWATLARDLGVGFEVWDFDTDVETCLLNNEWRRERGGRYVKPEAIRDIARRFPVSQWREITPLERVEVTDGMAPYISMLPNGKPTWLVDIDGTLAHNDGHRAFHDYSKVGDDKPRGVIIDLVKTLRKQGYEIVFMSGRKDSCRQETRDWLFDHLGAWADDCPLFMRSSDDNRNDAIVKYELFDTHVRDHYNVVGVLDDRDRVVAMWRAIGLDCLQVAPGDF